MAEGTRRSRSPAPPFQEALKLVSTDVMHWWISNHRQYFDIVQRETKKKIMYYGGYALNILLGSTKRESNRPSYNIDSYMRGMDMIGEEANDIDIKLMAVSDESNCSTAEHVLQSLRMCRGPPGTSFALYDMFGEEYIHRIAQQITHRNPYVIVAAGPEMLRGSGLKFIIAHNYQYGFKKHPICQVIITGILNNNKTQTLSEITITDEPAPSLPPGVPNIPGIYVTYSGSELCSQFITQFEAIKNKGNNERTLKTLKRIAYCIVYQLINEMHIKKDQEEFLTRIFIQEDRKYANHIKSVLNDERYNLIKNYLTEKGGKVKGGGRRRSRTRRRKGATRKLQR